MMFLQLQRKPPAKLVQILVMCKFQRPMGSLMSRGANDKSTADSKEQVDATDPLYMPPG